MSAADFWIIGCGNMAGAMLARWLETGLDASTVRVADPAMPAVPGGLTCFPAIQTDAGPAARVMLGIKPQGLAEAAPQIAPLVGPETELISMLAGIPLDTLKATFPSAGRIVRIMPNMPVRLGKGVVALYAEHGSEQAVEALMQPLGTIERVSDEALFDAVTALSGCGPAFLYRFIDAIAEAGTALGLPGDQAGRLSLATVEGAAALAAGSRESPAALADKVASKGGATRAGLDVLDDDDALKRLIAETLDAAACRSRELAKG